MGSGINGNNRVYLTSKTIDNPVPLPLWEVELMETQQQQKQLLETYPKPLPLWEVELMETNSISRILVP